MCFLFGLQLERKERARLPDLAAALPGQANGGDEALDHIQDHAHAQGRLRHDFVIVLLFSVVFISCCVADGVV